MSDVYVHACYIHVCVICDLLCTVSSPSLHIPTVNNNSASSSQLWSNISIGHSVEWPKERNHHAATHLHGPLFVIVGGMGRGDQVSTMWLCDTATKLWKKVYILSTLHVLMFITINKVIIAPVQEFSVNKLSPREDL